MPQSITQKRKKPLTDQELGKKLDMPAGQKVKEGPNKNVKNGVAPQVFSRPTGTGPERNVDITNLPPEQSRTIQEANSLEGMAMKQIQKEAMTDAAFERARENLRSPEEKAALEAIQSQQMMTPSTQVPNQPSVLQNIAQGANNARNPIDALTGVPTSVQGVLETASGLNNASTPQGMAAGLATTGVAVAGGAVAADLIAGAIASTTATTTAVAANSARATGFSKLVLGGLSTAGVLGPLTNVVSNKRQAVKTASTIRSEAEKNIGLIIADAKAGRYANNPNQAYMDWKAEIDNMNRAETSLKMISKGFLGMDLAGAQDELTKAQAYREGGFESDKFRLLQALQGKEVPVAQPTTTGVTE